MAPSAKAALVRKLASGGLFLGAHDNRPSVGFHGHQRQLCPCVRSPLTTAYGASVNCLLTLPTTTAPASVNFVRERPFFLKVSRGSILGRSYGRPNSPGKGSLIASRTC